MKTYLITYREKGNIYGLPVANKEVQAASFKDAIINDFHPGLTWLVIESLETGETITLVQVRKGHGLPEER